MNRRFLGFVARAFQWSVRLGSERSLLLGPLVVDAILVESAFYLLGLLWLKRSFSPAALGIFFGFFLVGQALAGGYLWRKTWENSLIRMSAGSLLAVVAYAVARKYLRGVVSPLTFAETLFALLPLQVVFRLWHAQVDGKISIHTRTLAVQAFARRWLYEVLRWPDRSETSGRWTFSLMLADGLAVAGTATAVGGFWLERSFAASELFTFAVVLVGCHVLTLTYAHRLPLRGFFLSGKLATGNALAWVLLTHRAAEQSLPTPVLPILLAFAPLQACLHFWHRRRTEAHEEVLGPLRWAILAAAVLALHRALLSNGAIGAGDSYWYNIMTADFVSQWRVGIFPVFAGQTEFAFNGAIAPVRFAPALQHIAGVIDLLTGHSLPFNGLLNLTLFCCFLSGACVCYRCLLAVAPRSPTIGLLLTLLYSSCPGVLALVYTGDLFMSITAVIFVPLAFYGCWLTLAKGDLRSVLLMVFALAALWYCHPPIALWCTLLAAVVQFVRLFRQFRTPGVYFQWGVGLLVFGVLTSYCFVSVLTAGQVEHPVSAAVIVENLRAAFPASLRPVSKNADALGDYQLGWSLWAVLSVGALSVGFLRQRAAAIALFAAIIALLLFLAPVPWLSEKLWLSVPRAICDITFLWPMQRFYLILAGLVVFGGAATLGPIAARRRWLAVLLSLSLVAAFNWSYREAEKFQRHTNVATPAQAKQQLFPQNRLLTRYAFNSFPDVPPYFSHGYIDPMTTSRLLTPSGEELFSPISELERDPDHIAPSVHGTFSATRPDPVLPHLLLEPKLRLEPHRRYFLQFDFAHPEFDGALRLFGARLARAYWLPDSAYGMTSVAPTRAFGALPGMTHGVTLWTDGDEAEEITVMFFFNGAGPASEVKTFGGYRLSEFDPAQFPIRVQQWAPYRAAVDAPTAGFLETPRQFISGYRARINGHEVPVRRSPGALVMVPVPAGRSTVELSYRGPLLLRCAYFISITAGLAVFTWLWLGRRRDFAPAVPD